MQGASHGEWQSTEYRAALLDEGHSSLFDGMAWEDKSIGGLQYNLMRNGFSPRFTKTPADLKDHPAALYVIVKPTVAFSPPEIDILEQYVNDGGWLLVSAGWDTYPAVRDLYERFGLGIANIPLGKAEGEGLGKPVKMQNAYPVTGEGEDIQILIQAFGQPVAKVVHRGRGGAIIIGDSDFLLNINLEGQNEFVVMENIVFLRELFAATMGIRQP